MAFLEWKSEYSVDIQPIDKQHKKLFEMINQLHDAMSSGAGSKLVPVILNNLIAYTRDHFSDEEKLMARAGYPALVSHKAEHDKLTNEVVQLAKGLENGSSVLSAELLDFLQKWLRNHILTTDKQYISRMQAAGIQ